MANWANTYYRVYGDEKTLKKFSEIINKWRKNEDSDEATLCEMLAIPKESYEGRYLRGGFSFCMGYGAAWGGHLSGRQDNR